MTGSSSGFEWILLAVGGVLTLVLLGFFVFVLTRKDDKDS
jgi:hypothetical protein